MNGNEVNDQPPNGDERRDVQDAHNDDLENVLPETLKNHPVVRAFQITRASFIITNARLPGNPIVYASPRFLYLTGYSIERILGRNCRFLQGPETDPAAVARLREAVDNGRDTAVTLLNYRSDGTTFWNQVLISGVWEEVDGESTLLYFIGLQHPTARPAETD